MTRLGITLLVLAVTPTVALAGGGKARGKARAAKLDVAGAVASGDADRQCAVALALVARGDHVRASFLVGRCAEVPGRAEAARAARVAISRRAAAEDWSPVEIGFRGDDAAAPPAVAIEQLADVPVPVGVWKLPAGDYVIRAGEVVHRLHLEAHSRALVLLDRPVATAAAPARVGVIDFSRDQGGPIDAPIAGPPPKAKHESLLPKRFRAGLKTCGAMACRRAP